ncbi:MAG: GNAT family N-acetyltransferase [Pseudoxanthomonas sp.]
MTSAHPRLELRLPRLDEEAEVLRAHRAASPSNPTFLHYYREGMEFAAYLHVLHEQQRGENLPTPEHVPSSFLFAFDGVCIVGRVSLRHRLAPTRGQAYGHIGYAVTPEFRNRGYATAMLAQALRIAHDDLHIASVLVTCDEDNAASIKVIERNGGRFDGLVDALFLAKPKRRYWFDAAG